MTRSLRTDMKDSWICKFGKPEEVEYAVVFLASDEVVSITGEVINTKGEVYL